MFRASVLAVVAAAALCGGCKVKSSKQPCKDGKCPVAVNRAEVPYPTFSVREIPAMNLPLSSRQKNWTSPSGSGSCVVASTVMLLRWQGMDEMAQLFRESYSGGQTSTSINAKMAANNLRYAYTESGDVAFLEWACRTRRGAGIGYFTAHCVCLVDLTDTTAYLCDNNRIGQYIEIPREQFIREWRQRYSGWAFSVVYSPAPPLAYDIN